MDTFDFVIVGAGTGGCGLAYRLGEQGFSVCVLEAGPKDNHPLIRIPSGAMKTIQNPKITWQYEIEGTEQIKHRKMPVYYGKTLGGSSAVNGMVYNRGQPSDFDDWARKGNAGWDYRSVLPYFRKTERFLTGGEDEFRGRDGLVPVQVLQTQDAMSDAFIQAAVATGVPINPDYNGRSQEGVSYVQGVIHKGKRWSSAHTHLHPAIKRFGIDVRTEALARKILIVEGRAVGVEYLRAGSDKVHTVRSKLSTIISAGATFTPKLLQLSGLGPRSLLQDFNIPVLTELPGVGENLSDHYSARVVARTRPGFGSVNERARGIPLAIEAIKWILGKPSVLALNSMTVFAACKSDPTARDTDYLLMFLPASLKGGRTRVLDSFPGFTGGTWQQRPESRGYVRIRSADVNVAPVIQPNYLDQEIDRRIQVIAMKHLMAVLRSEPLQHIVEEFTYPSPLCQTDDEWLDHIRGSGMTSFHPCGTCKMGPRSDPMAVVDSRLRVHGVEGLRIVDASVIPEPLSGNLNAAVQMIAEKSADLILEDVRGH